MTLSTHETNEPAKLLRMLPVRLLQKFIDLKRRRFKGRLVLNYDLGTICSMEERSIEYLDKRKT